MNPANRKAGLQQKNKFFSKKSKQVSERKINFSGVTYYKAVTEM